MKHASAEALRQLDPLLERLRVLPALVERKPGVFYRGASAFLHFHEDPAGLFVDVKLDGTSFSRFKLSGSSDNEALLVKVSASLSAHRASAPRKAGSW
ncbi:MULTISPECIES: hypothetical protein [Acidithiobacillus]|uniref:Uncharacterized protein n=1 Tax=Acidithiobacillus thiooxidans ATCC 19377 TaxID=637390 RepID=A0A543Q332_ACITH|nr:MULTISPECIES: hypothetical protein [Acidithiobacillus]MDX5935164.1 hypothetical protein [Acidithiobacillus thiooxidans]TQN50700.1 hypothetical protein DLNHIDIE_00555 [Acidithiobacillus thiooxidans ATCC 19377]